MNPPRLLVLASLPTALLAVEPENAFRELVRSSDPRSPEQEQAALRVPPGFEVQLVASEPDLRKPMNMQWDALGRLWVTESREYPQAVRDGTPGRDSVRVFSDFAPDGRARKMELFADGLNIPTGLYPFRSKNAEGKLTWKCVVWSIPNIWLLEDSDGDGKADRREVLFGPLGWERDTHGNLSSFRRGLDGWLYGTHGFNNESTLRGRDGSELRIQSGNTWRVQLDGSRVEGWTYGQVNPFGLCWDNRGNLFSADCHSSPIYQLLRGAFYPSFGKPHDGLGFAPQTITHSHGSTAICAPVYVCDASWPAAWQDHMFVGNVQTSRINHDAIAWRGSSSKGGELPDFLVSEDPWFRPVDLSWGPDGALYVADFYNRIIGHYEVPLDHPGRDRERGRLWRIVYRGEKESSRAKMPDPALAPRVDGLVRELSSGNLTRRTLALHELCDVHGTGALPALQAAHAAPVNALQKLTTLWALQRLGSLPESTFLAALRDGDPLVRVHALKIATASTEAACRRGSEAPGSTNPSLAAAVRSAFSDADPFVRRAAVEFTAANPSPSNVQPLLSALQAALPEDDHLLHAAKIALRNQLQNPAALAKISLSELDAAARSFALEALTAVAGEQAAQLRLSFFQKQEDCPLPVLGSHLSSLARNLPTHALESLFDLARRRLGTPSDVAANGLSDLLSAIEARGVAPGKTLHEWAHTLADELLATPAPSALQVQAAARFVRTFRFPGFEEALMRAGIHPKAEPETCALVARALLTVAPQASLARLAPLLADSAFPSAVRGRLATALADTREKFAFQGILAALGPAPYQIQKTFATALAASAEGAESLLEACAEGKAPARLLRERPLLERIRAGKLPGLEERIAKLTANLPAADALLDKLIADRRAGFDPAKLSVERGAGVFARNCAICHALEGQGGVLGPQLDGVGARGADRLLEDILDPNRNVDRAFRLTLLTLTNGSVVAGLPRGEEGEQLVFSAADGAAQEIRVRKADVSARKETETSLMPAAFGEILKPEELNDLLGFLLTKRPR